MTDKIHIKNRGELNFAFITWLDGFVLVDATKSTEEHAGITVSLFFEHPTAEILSVCVDICDDVFNVITDELPWYDKQVRTIDMLVETNIVNGEVQPLNDPQKSLGYETDNRDLHETWLRIEGSSYRLDIDPIEMFRNALTNSGMSEIEASAIIDAAMTRIDEINGDEEQAN